MTGLIKVSRIYPEHGVGYLNCPCGAKPPIGAVECYVVCPCGAVYTADGWKVNSGLEAV